MCNPKPGIRCFNDTYKALTKSVERFIKAYKSGDESAIETATEKLNEDRVFYYATNYAKNNSIDAKNNGKDALTSIPKEFKDRLDKEEEVETIGKLLNSFQTVADKYRKGAKVSSVVTARKMYNGGCEKVLEHGKKDNQNKRDAKISNIPNGIDLDVAKARGKAIEQEATVKARLLEKAHSYALADAKKVLDRDIKKNSKVVDYPIDPRTVFYKKNTDGTFTVTTKFDVKANNFGEAMDMAESTFGIEDVETTVELIADKPDHRRITSTYIYYDSENVDDAEAFQKFDAWKGSPKYRSSLG